MPAVGSAAKQGKIRNAQNTVCNVKQILGRSSDDQILQQYMESSPVKMTLQDDEPVFKVEHKGQAKDVPPSKIAEAIYLRMLETARSHGDGDIHDSVLAVPCDFSEDQKQAISESANAAGFSVLRTVSEPVSALLSYDIGQTDNTLECNVLVFRIGNSRAVAGSKFTDSLTDYLATEFYKKYKLDVKESRRSVKKLRLEADNVKHSLSTLGNAQCAVESLFEGVDFHCQVSRARFESLISPVVQLCPSLIDNLCTTADITKSDIQKVVMCGGGTKIPCVQKIITDSLPNAEILNSIPPDEVIAIGAAKQAAILTGSDETDIKVNFEQSEVECLKKSICVKAASESTCQLYPVFPALTPFPCRKHETVTLPSNQTSFKLELCECSNNNSVDADLGKLVMQDLPKSAVVSIVFHLRRDGSLHVTCKEASSEKTVSITVEVQS
ncbi:Heat shock 70 kDa protein 14 [Mytilus edulis]|uniref:Heat shock 70 kDa protein 14 n=1 Tax=Mytilus edulis TaxID=6550 RepID=A0A8S3VAN7_MYTED|nr:Heat shock 70 kDa protein 14 [Mytilus edulis]